MTKDMTTIEASNKICYPTQPAASNQTNIRLQAHCQGSRAEDARSAFCSHAVTTSSEANYDSSLSSMNQSCEINNQDDIVFMGHSRSIEFNQKVSRGGQPPPAGQKCEPEAKIQTANRVHGQLTSNLCNQKAPPTNYDKNKTSHCKRDTEIVVDNLVSKCSNDLSRRSNSNNDNDERGNRKRGSFEQLKERGTWGKNIEFLLAVIGFAVDLGNVWRFPYICYRNGGGAFLVPYTVMFIIGGVPIFYMEMCIGQYFASGCLTIWRRICPMAKGVGYAMCVLNFFTGLYYNTIISWAVFYFMHSFALTLPWTSCGNSWNEARCMTIIQRGEMKNELTNYTSPTKDYFEREVLRLSSGIDDLGSIRKPLAAYLAIVFICIYFAIWKGVKSTGKAVWITALLPYFVLLPLLARGMFLEGAGSGILYYLLPEWSKILDGGVWVEAAKQIFFSLGPGFGTLMALSSYNRFDHDCRRDALIAAAVNYFASFIAGLVIFAVLGYMATIQNADISTVATEGPGLVFQVYPEGLATMQFAPFWSVLFFAMVIALGIDSTFGGLESVITGLCDEYPRVLRAHRGIFIGVLITFIYLCSLPTTAQGGNYVINVLESYGTSLSLLFIVMVETMIVCWLYGAERFCDNLEEMSGRRPGAYWRICWKYISPSLLLLIFIAACKQELEKYHTLVIDGYTFPSWAPSIGLLMTGASVCCIPAYAIYHICYKETGNLKQRFERSIRPADLNQRTDKDIYVDSLGDSIHVDTVI